MTRRRGSFWRRRKRTRGKPIRCSVCSRRRTGRGCTLTGAGDVGVCDRVWSNSARPGAGRMPNANGGVSNARTPAGERGGSRKADGLEAAGHRARVSGDRAGIGDAARGGIACSGAVARGSGGRGAIKTGSADQGAVVEVFACHGRSGRDRGGCSAGRWRVHEVQRGARLERGGSHRTGSVRRVSEMAVHGTGGDRGGRGSSVSRRMAETSEGSGAPAVVDATGGIGGGTRMGGSRELSTRLGGWVGRCGRAPGRASVRRLWVVALLIVIGLILELL